jgi:predicted AlkP superfamily pyrophosphatase or phosphodiesterase
LTITALIVLDGLRPDALEMVHTPHLDGFRASGSWTMSATTVFPSITLPCHLSMLTSVPPEVHGVLDNTWQEQGRHQANLIDQIARSGRMPVAFYTWEPLRDLWTPGCMAATWFRNAAYSADGDQETPRAVADYFARFEASFAFIYLGSIDIVGHVHGWMSDEYLRQIEKVDEIFGGVLAGLGNDATILVTSDHGGHDTVHGTDRPEDLLVPWMIAGPEIRVGHQLANEVTALDVAPTLARIMGLRHLKSWQGSPVEEAFEKGRGPGGIATRARLE